MMMAAGTASASLPEKQTPAPVDITPDVLTIVGICTQNKSVLEEFGFSADSDLAKHYLVVNESYANKLEDAGFDGAPCHNLS